MTLPHTQIVARNDPAEKQFSAGTTGDRLLNLEITIPESLAERRPADLARTFLRGTVERTASPNIDILAGPTLAERQPATRADSCIAL